MILYIGNNQRADARPELCFELFEHFIKISAFPIQLSNIDHPGFALFFCHFIGFFTSGGQSGFPGNSYNHAVCSADCFAHSPDKIKQSRCIQQVHFAIFIFKRRDRKPNGSLSFGFFRIKVANCGAIRNGSQPVGCTCSIQKRFSQSCFPGAAMPYNGNVFNVVCIILFHGKSLHSFESLEAACFLIWNIAGFVCAIYPFLPTLCSILYHSYRYGATAKLSNNLKNIC